MIRRVLAGSAVVAAVGVGLVYRTSLRGEPGARPLGHPYQPVSAGASWTYEVRQRHAASGDVPTMRIQERVSGMLVVGERLTADVETAVERGAARPTHTIVVTPEGVLPELEIQAAGASMRAVGSSGVYLPAEVRTGMRWRYRVEFETAAGARSFVEARMQAVGEQRLEVPAGAFDVVHLRRELSSGDHHQSDDLYYARGVGLVAATTTTAAGYRADRTLVGYELPSPR